VNHQTTSKVYVPPKLIPGYTQCTQRTQHTHDDTHTYTWKIFGNSMQVYESSPDTRKGPDALTESIVCG